MLGREALLIVILIFVITLGLIARKKEHKMTYRNIEYFRFEVPVEGAKKLEIDIEKPGKEPAEKRIRIELDREKKEEREFKFRLE